MRSVRLEVAIPLAVALIVGLFSGVHVIERHADFGPAAIVADLESATTLTTLIVIGFLWFGWKVKWFRPWLVLVPDLEGCWTGTITPLGDAAVPPFPVVAQVRQSLSQVSVIAWTARAKSTSYGGTIATDEASGEQRLVYAYIGDAKLDGRDGNPRHDGATNLVIANGGERLEGNYWTDRLTRGTMRLERLSVTAAVDPEAVLRGLGQAVESAATGVDAE